MNPSAMPRLLAFVGSARRESLNKRLMLAAVAAARARGGEVTVIDPADWPLPLYDGDLEAAEGMPERVLRLKAEFAAHAGWIIVSPEHNGFFSAQLKNTIDWLSRPVAGQASPFAGKVAAVFGASPGALGGIRMLPHLRLQLANLGVTVLPGQLALPHADQAFADDGRLRDAGLQAALEAAVGPLVHTVRALGAGPVA